MALNIKNPEAENLAHRLAAATGESLTGAVTTALRERLARVQASDQSAAAERAQRLRAVSQDASGRWAEAYRTGQHGDLLYDEVGLPQ
jgi:antitoxin VapB